MVSERRRSRGLKCHLSCVGSSLHVYINKTCDDITDLVESSPALPRHEERERRGPISSLSGIFECSPGAGCSVLLMEVTPVYLENPLPGNYCLDTHISLSPSSPPKHWGHRPSRDRTSREDTYLS